MIESVTIENFRCFAHLTAECAPINMVVGDNGVGKTTLLEAMFLTLCSNPQKALLLRQFRGLDGVFSGDPDTMAASFYADLFHDPSGKPVAISLVGSGPELRTLRIQRGPGDVRIVPDATKPSETQIISPVIFEWTDSENNVHVSRTKISAKGIEFENTSEKLPLWFFYASQNPTSSAEAAERFSILRREGKAEKFVKVLTENFDWINDISVESYGGTPALHASLRSPKRLLPLATVSGAINRFAVILLSMAYRQGGIVLVDEIENGIFFARQPQLMKALIDFSREYECQLFLSTHSRELLESFAKAAGDDVSDIELWRLERGKRQPQLRRFAGPTFKAGVEYGEEIRG
jgi:AAA15 family ATPase/GTPase